MAPQQRTFSDWDWWTGAGAQSAARKEFDSLSMDGQSALAEVMRRWLVGSCNRSEVEMVEKGLWELKTRVGSNHFRILFGIQGTVCWVLTAFYKNQRQLTEQEKKRARSRLKTL